MPLKDKTKNTSYQREWATKQRQTRKQNGTRRDYFLKSRYGISEKEWEALFDAQGRCCAICKSNEPQSRVGWHTDHEKGTKNIRGILCENCNRGLGMYRDDISNLRRAAAYLGLHQGVLGSRGIEIAKIVSPFSPRSISNGMSYGVSVSGYDIRLDQDVELVAREFKLASAMEYFSMSNDLVGIVHDKSSLARRGLQVFNTVIEPGWRGYLTMELVNHSAVPIKLMRGDPIAQVLFHSLDEPAEKPYAGKYQDQKRGVQKPLKEDGSPL